MATFSIHFDGPITVEHQVSIRVLSKTYEHMQRAIDRAYLINLHGEVWKHARLTAEQYQDTEFIAAYPREGGIILDAYRILGGDILMDKIANAIRPIFDNASNNGVNAHASLASQIIERKNYVQRVGNNAPEFEEVFNNPPPDWAPGYSNRAIVKEIDQLVNQITPERLDGSTAEITLNGVDAHLPFVFTQETARRFHGIASKRELGAPFIVNARIRSLDMGNRYAKPSAKILNIDTNKEVSLKLRSLDDFYQLQPHHRGESIRIFACPIIEALGFDVYGGDLQYLSVVI